MPSLCRRSGVLLLVVGFAHGELALLSANSTVRRNNRESVRSCEESAKSDVGGFEETDIPSQVGLPSCNPGSTNAPEQFVFSAPMERLPKHN